LALDVALAVAGKFLKAIRHPEPWAVAPENAWTIDSLELKSNWHFNRAQKLALAWLGGRRCNLCCRGGILTWLQLQAGVLL
jgi:hypothetical protein